MHICISCTYQYMFVCRRARERTRARAQICQASDLRAFLAVAGAKEEIFGQKEINIGIERILY